MSKKFRSRKTASRTSAALNWCKKIIEKYFRGGRLDPQYDVLQAASANRWLQMELSEDCVELNELIGILRIGDRVRVFCDDGFVVAEKVSHTKMKVIQSQAMAELIH